MGPGHDQQAESSLLSSCIDWHRDLTKTWAENNDCYHLLSELSSIYFNIICYLSYLQGQTFLDTQNSDIYGTGMRGQPGLPQMLPHLVSVSTGRSSFASSASLERHFFSTEEYMGPPLGVENAGSGGNEKQQLLL